MNSSTNTTEIIPANNAIKIKEIFVVDLPKKGQRHSDFNWCLLLFRRGITYNVKVTSNIAWVRTYGRPVICFVIRINKSSILILKRINKMKERSPLTSENIELTIFFFYFQVSSINNLFFEKYGCSYVRISMLFFLRE